MDSNFTEIARGYSGRRETITVRVNDPLAGRLRQYHERSGEVLLYQEAIARQDDTWHWRAWMTIGGVKVVSEEMERDNPVEHFADPVVGNDGTGKFTVKKTNATKLIRHIVEVAR